ncbi:hypothetical protein VDGL01_10748 [Verticillium dahliae]
MPYELMASVETLVLGLWHHTLRLAPRKSRKLACNPATRTLIVGGFGRVWRGRWRVEGGMRGGGCRAGVEEGAKLGTWRLAESATQIARTFSFPWSAPPLGPGSVTSSSKSKEGVGVGGGERREGKEGFECRSTRLDRGDKHIAAGAYRRAAHAQVATCNVVKPGKPGKTRMLCMRESLGSLGNGEICMIRSIPASCENRHSRYSLSLWMTRRLEAWELRDKLVSRNTRTLQAAISGGRSKSVGLLGKALAEFRVVSNPQRSAANE